MKHNFPKTFSIAATALVLLATYIMGTVQADGIPKSEPLYYTGIIEDNGSPIDGERTVQVILWDAQSSGTQKCSTTGKIAVVKGWFKLALETPCVQAIHENSELWAGVSINGKQLPRTKLGAVPYSVESAKASAASGALKKELDQIKQDILKLKQTGGGTVNLIESGIYTGILSRAYNENGVKTSKAYVRFTKPFTKVPKVLVSISKLRSTTYVYGSSSGGSTVQTVDISAMAVDISVSGFNIQLTSERGTSTQSIAVTWLAIQ